MLPRTAVIEAGWREARIDAPAFISRSGTLLARAHKCLIDPLVIRARENRHLGAALLDADAVAEVTELLAKYAPTLEAASRWFDELRATRRKLGITDGNIQELYFPRSFELATQYGLPEAIACDGHDAGASADAICRETLAEIHELDLPSTQQLAAFLARPDVTARLERRLAEDWPADVPELDLPTIADAAGEALAGDSDSYLKLASHAAADLGLACRSRTGLVPKLLAGVPGASGRVELSATDPCEPPPVTDRPEYLPLDRPLAVRMRSTVRRLRGTGVALTVSELADDEAYRATGPWGLNSPVLAAVFVLGIVIAASVSPFADAQPTAPLPELTERIQARLRKEGYVLHLRRSVSSGRALHPAQQEVVARLHDFGAAYIARLWVRLHGWDVMKREPEDLAEASEILTGVARSVNMDQRQAIRLALEQEAS